MITPAFDLSQNDNYLLLKIKAPYAKVSEAEVFFEGTDFKFYSKPYFLRLNLPGSVVENGSELMTYDVDEGSYSIQIPKACPGEYFEGLDLQTKLLAPRGKIHTGPLIQVVESSCPEEMQNQEEDEEFDWEIYQNQYTEQDSDETLLNNVKYGFAGQKSDAKLFSRLQEEMPDLLDVKILCQNSASQRKIERIQAETLDFCEDHYLVDLYENDDITKIAEFSPFWDALVQQKQDNPSMAYEEIVVFSEEEKAKMRNLPNKEFLLDKAAKREVLLSLVDILFAFAYNVRTTEGDDTVESAWTICKLSSTLSWLETYSSLESVVVTCIRRTLCYPLYRQWNLALTVFNDTIKIMSLGPRFVLKCLLQIHSLFNESEPRYILNDLYITDYCVWIQSIRCEVLLNLSEALKKISVNKSCVELDLPELESAAAAVLNESLTTEDLSNKLCELSIEASSSDSSHHDSESDSSDDDDDDSSSSLDSDDYSSSENDNTSSSDDDDDSDVNEGSAENCLLLGNIHTIEKIR